MDTADTRHTYPAMPLSAWYAEPLSPAEAEQLLARSHAEEQAALLDSREVFPPRIRRLVARFWLQKNIEHDFRSLSASFTAPYEQALLHLVYGQLLMSCKRSHAMDYLRQGFLMSVPYLASGEYFEVMKRHQRLGRLVLTPGGLPPQPLQSLLQEGGVIERLAGVAAGHRKPEHKDTLG